MGEQSLTPVAEETETSQKSVTLAVTIFLGCTPSEIFLVKYSCTNIIFFYNFQNFTNIMLHKASDLLLELKTEL